MKQLQNNTTKVKKIQFKKNYFLIILIASIFICLFGLFNFFYLYNSGGVINNNNEKIITVSIEKGSTATQIAQKLENSNIIKSSLFFLLKCKSEGIDNDFKYGNFYLSPSMNFYEITEVLKSSSFSDDYITLLIKEGETQKDIAKKLDELGVTTYDEFMYACNNLDFDFEFLKDLPKRESRLEGYLYPDTYFISPNEEPKDIINKILTRFNEFFVSELKDNIKNSSFTLDELIIIASIIEKEIRIPEEKPLASSVIYNRLAQNMKLQMDSTVLYSLGEHKDRVVYKDLEIESEYNTYYVNGLPLGPICNPNIESIKAALNPAKTDYLYYVVKDLKTGEHFYTNDYNQFLTYKQKYVSKFN